VGVAKTSAKERTGRGMVVKTKKRRYEHPKPKPRRRTWRDVVKANEEALLKKEAEAIKFIRHTCANTNKKPTVAFSGGKDSLVTLLLVEKALQETPPLIFTDTGLEFPETLEYVDQVFEGRDAKIVRAEAGNRFWEALPEFGPPGRDYRWCCKICKLGPTSKKIKNSFPGGCLTFIGHRRYESERRSSQPRIWKNPWVPNQVGASPIHNWSAFEIWLYIFRENVSYNPLYNQGFHRLGCWLCPASDLSEMENTGRTHPEMWRGWLDHLHSYAKKIGVPTKWVDHGFWRWKNPPDGVKTLAKQIGIQIPEKHVERGEITFSSPCTGVTMLETQVSDHVDLHLVSNLLPILGKHKLSPGMGVALVKSKDVKIHIYQNGRVTIRGNVEEKKLLAWLRRVKEIVLRSVLCTGCGVCVNHCPRGAINLVGGRAKVTASKCTSCQVCLGFCPLNMRSHEALDGYTYRG
ncbi:MAG: phosphoadenosine phosphosulfate reductase, partial [Methanobacteriota archaeon]